MNLLPGKNITFKCLSILLQNLPRPIKAMHAADGCTEVYDAEQQMLCQRILCTWKELQLPDLSLVSST